MWALHVNDESGVSSQGGSVSLDIRVDPWASQLSIPVHFVNPKLLLCHCLCHELMPSSSLTSLTPATTCLCRQYTFDIAGYGISLQTMAMMDKCREQQAWGVSRWWRVNGSSKVEVLPSMKSYSASTFFLKEGYFRPLHQNDACDHIIKQKAQIGLRLGTISQEEPK